MEKKVGCRGSELSDDGNLTSQKKCLYSSSDLTEEQVTESFVDSKIQLVYMYLKAKSYFVDLDFNQQCCIKYPKVILE